MWEVTLANWTLKITLFYPLPTWEPAPLQWDRWAGEADNWPSQNRAKLTRQEPLLKSVTFPEAPAFRAGEDTPTLRKSPPSSFLCPKWSHTSSRESSWSPCSDCLEGWGWWLCYVWHQRWWSCGWRVWVGHDSLYSQLSLCWWNCWIQWCFSVSGHSEGVPVREKGISYPHQSWNRKKCDVYTAKHTSVNLKNVFIF